MTKKVKAEDVEQALEIATLRKVLVEAMEVIGDRHEFEDLEELYDLMEHTLNQSGLGLKQLQHIALLEKVVEASRHARIVKSGPHWEIYHDALAALDGHTGR